MVHMTLKDLFCDQDTSTSRTDRRTDNLL